MRNNNSLYENELEADLMKDNNKKKPIFDGIRCEDSLYLFPKSSWLRIFFYRMVTHHHFENAILLLIVFSSLKLAIDTYLFDNEAATSVSNFIDYGFNIAFGLEAILKIICILILIFMLQAFGFFMDENSYLRESWSQLDFFIVISSTIDMSFESIDLPVIKVLRLLRTLRPLRFISHNVNLKVVVIALLESVGAIFNVMIVVILIW
jgi:hypothetical protein